MLFCTANIKEKDMKRSIVKFLFSEYYKKPRFFTSTFKYTSNIFSMHESRIFSTGVRRLFEFAGEEGVGVWGIFW